MDYDDAVRSSWIAEELQKVKNAQPAVAKWGEDLGTVLAGIDMWMRTLKIGLPITMKHHRDHEMLQRADLHQKIAYPKPDGKLSFDKLTNVAFSYTNHAEDQPVHLKVCDWELQKTSELAEYDGDMNRYKRDLAAYISPRDWRQFVTRAIETEDISNSDGVPFIVCYVVSENTRRFMSIENSRRILDYKPEDDAEVIWAEDVRNALAGENPHPGRVGPGRRHLQLHRADRASRRLRTDEVLQKRLGQGRVAGLRANHGHPARGRLQRFAVHRVRGQGRRGRPRGSRAEGRG